MTESQAHISQLLLTKEIAGALLDDLKVKLVQADPNLRVVACTPGLRALLDDPDSELLHRSLAELFPELIGAEEELAAVAAGISPRFDLPMINRLVPCSQERRYLTLTALADPMARNHLLLVVRDVTVEGRLDQRAMQQLNEIRLLRVGLEAANKRLIRLDEEKSAFLRMAAHDLRAPLTVVKGYVEMVVEDMVAASDETAEYLDIVLRRTDQMAGLIDDLLDVERIESGEVALRLEAVDMAHLLDETIKGFAPVAQQKGLTLHSEVAPGLRSPGLDGATLQGDRARLAQALGNLVSNAIKFTPAGGKVEVAGFQHEDRVVIEVRDTGPGISEEDQSRLFQRFFRTDDARLQHIPGTGLGLSIVQAITEQHGGQVSCRSQIGHGSTFSLSLPLGQGATQGEG